MNNFFIDFFERFYFFLKIFLWIFLFLIILSNLVIFYFSNGKIFYDIENIPKSNYGLLLGTSKYTVGDIGLLNIFYNERIKSANSLTRFQKIKYLILSGSSDGGNYNEAKTMELDLLKKGAEKSSLILDNDGFRTFDSILNLKNKISEKKIIIVSQKFHLQRAVAIAEINGFDAVGYVAKNPPFFSSLKTYIREIFSRINFLFDIL